MKEYLKDFWFWYKDFGVKYGWFWAFGYARFNALYFNRNGQWKRNTNGEINENK